MTTMDAMTYLEEATASFMTVAVNYQQVDPGVSTMRWIHNNKQNFDWMLTIATKDMGPEQVATFMDDSLEQVAEHRHKVMEALGVGLNGVLCPVIVANGVRDDTRAFVKSYHRGIQTKAKCQRWLLPIIVDLDAGELVFPDRLPARMQPGGLVGHSNVKSARNQSEKYLVFKAAASEAA